MVTLATAPVTLVDWSKRVDPDGKIAMIAELLTQQNDILLDMPLVEANGPTSHRLTVRTGLPVATWRKLNQGVVPTKSTTAQFDEAIGMLEEWSEVDEKLANLNGNVNAFRFSEALAKFESMNQEMAQTLFFGNAALDPEEFTGLSPRYNTLSGPPIADNVIDGGGSGSDNTSIWLIVWSPMTIFGLFPKGMQGGLRHEDFGVETVETTAGISGARMRAYREKFSWDNGLAVKDWRFAVRIPNLDVSDLSANSGAQADLIDLMIRAIHRIPNLKMGRPAFYVNRVVFQMLDIQRRDDVISGGGLRFVDVDGVAIPQFRGIPVRIVDALVETEAQVT